MTKNNTLTYRVGQLEKCTEKVESKMDQIMENHLPHIQQELTQLKTRIDVLTFVNIGALILATVINKFL